MGSRAAILGRTALAVCPASAFSPMSFSYPSLTSRLEPVARPLPSTGSRCGIDVVFSAFRIPGGLREMEGAGRQVGMDGGGQARTGRQPAATRHNQRNQPQSATINAISRNQVQSAAISRDQSRSISPMARAASPPASREEGHYRAAAPRVEVVPQLGLRRAVPIVRRPLLRLSSMCDPRWDPQRPSNRTVGWVPCQTPVEQPWARLASTRRLPPCCCCSTNSRLPST